MRCVHCLPQLQRDGISRPGCGNCRRVSAAYPLPTNSPQPLHSRAPCCHPSLAPTATASRTHRAPPRTPAPPHLAVLAQPRLPHLRFLHMRLHHRVDGVPVAAPCLELTRAVSACRTAHRTQRTPHTARGLAHALQPSQLREGDVACTRTRVPGFAVRSSGVAVRAVQPDSFVVDGVQVG